MNLERILVALDFSPCSRLALKAAGGLARLGKGRLVLVHALDLPESNTLIGGALRPLVDVEAEKARAEAALKLEAEQQGVADLVAGYVVALHQPGYEVPEAARTQQCGLVVVGTRGKTGFKHFLLGSEAEKILHHCAVPVLVVPEPKH